MKYAIVGTGARHSMFSLAIAETYPASCELVGLCDSNPVRLARGAEMIPRQAGNGVPTYRADEFDKMIAEQKPDTVIVTVPDYLHHLYIVRALRAGCRVMTEKPMTTDLRRLKAILDAQQETGRSVTVTFNYRYTPARTQLKALLQSGAIGEIAAVDFRWHLDRVHGADYFRRWHRDKEKSGGLLVHKATHHFDLANWLIGSTPRFVYANGRLVFYTPATAERLGLEMRGERCLDCPAAGRCDFRLDIETDEALNGLYRAAEGEDGYFRDRCVFSQDISIEDTMQVQVRYANDVTMNYTLCAYSPWEGLEIVFHGTKGELTHRHVEIHGVFGGTRDFNNRDEIRTELHVAGEHRQMLDVPKAAGDHGGGDPVMLGYLFDPANMEPDRYGRSSSHVDGAWSILTGIAANESMKSAKAVDVDQLLEAHGIQLQRPLGPARRQDRGQP